MMVHSLCSASFTLFNVQCHVEQHMALFQRITSTTYRSLHVSIAHDLPELLRLSSLCVQDHP